MLILLPYTYFFLPSKPQHRNYDDVQINYNDSSQKIEKKKHTASAARARVYSLRSKWETAPDYSRERDAAENEKKKTIVYRNANKSSDDKTFNPYPKQGSDQNVWRDARGVSKTPFRNQFTYRRM